MHAVYTEEGIWAVGGTPADAIDTFCREGRISQEDYEREFGPIETAPITTRLAEYIDEHGFDCKHDSYHVLPDGTLDLPASDGTYTLTTEHAASSYGMPVLVVDGAAYGPGDLLSDGESASEWVERWSRDPERTEDERDDARRFLGRR